MDITKMERTPIKIGIVCYPTFGGSGVVATELGKGLAKMGHEIHFITSSQPVKLDSFTQNITFHEVSFSRYPLFEFQPYEVALTSKLVDVVKHENLDVLHVHYAIPHASAAFMAKQILKSEGINIPYITTLHGTDITLVGKDPAYEPTITFAINQSDIVTTVSHSLKKDTYDHFAVEKEIEVVHNFVCLEKYQKKEHSECKNHIFAPNGEKVLIHVSNFRKVKRVEDVIKIAAKVMEQTPAKLMLIGDGPERANLEKLARSLGIEKNTFFMGKLKNISEALCVADVFLMTSEFESFGVAALEAMAAGVPVISSNTGGIPEVNLQGETGYLSNVGDVESMSKNTLQLFSSEETYNTFSLNAKKRAEHFAIEKILPQYLNLYYKAIDSVEK